VVLSWVVLIVSVWDVFRVATCGYVTIFQPTIAYEESRDSRAQETVFPGSVLIDIDSVAVRLLTIDDAPLLVVSAGAEPVGIQPAQAAHAKNRITTATAPARSHQRSLIDRVRVRPYLVARSSLTAADFPALKAPVHDDCRPND
jgi:hypothetical protein